MTYLTAQSLPTYDLGPGRSGDELVVNLLIYGMLLALLLSVLWVLIPFAQSARDRRRNGSTADR